MRYVVATKNPTRIQLTDLEKFYFDHGKDPAFIPKVRECKELKTISSRFNHIIAKLNQEHCRTLVPHGVGVQNLICAPDPIDDPDPATEPDEAPIIYTVAITNIIQPDCMPWISSFSSREKANAFIAEAEERISSVGAEHLLTVTLDSGRLNSTNYLDEIVETYSMERD